jgi:Protein of unknown function (DUF2851)
VEESFLHYIWQLQYFDKTGICTVQGESIDVIDPGRYNHHAGPDFDFARLRIGGVYWAGSVEIHTQSSFWLAHKHHLDEAYENVVLHVVWVNDQSLYRVDGTALPTVELKGRVDEGLIRQYRKLVADTSSIPCSSSLHRVEEVIRHSMMDQTLVERLDRRSSTILADLGKNKGDWQQTAYSWVLRHFGFKVNNLPFAQLADSLPLKTLMKHADHLLQMEALLFGQAGFLEFDVGDAYYLELRHEYGVLARKYRLSGLRMKRSQWRFLRMRPANFPTVRIAQLAAMISFRKTLFSDVFVERDYSTLRKAFLTSVSSYWKSHYRFNLESKRTLDGLGESGLDVILINAVVPLLVAYGKHHGNPGIDRALELLCAIPSENNSILRLWREVGVDAQHAFDSQALVELYNSYCLKRKCLNCKIGARFLKPIA